MKNEKILWKNIMRCGVKMWRRNAALSSFCVRSKFGLICRLGHTNPVIRKFGVFISEKHFEDIIKLLNFSSTIYLLSNLLCIILFKQFLCQSPVCNTGKT